MTYQEWVIERLLPRPLLFRNVRKRIGGLYIMNDFFSEFLKTLNALDLVALRNEAKIANDHDTLNAVEIELKRRRQSVNNVVEAK